MNRRALMTGKSDVSELARVLGLEHGLHAAARREDSFWIGHSDHFMKLQKIDPIRLQAAEGFVDLLLDRRFVATVDFGHQEHFFAIPVPERLPHTDLAQTAAIVPAVVHEVDVVIDGGTHDFNALMVAGRPAEVTATQADDRYLLLRAPKPTVRHLSFEPSG